MKKRMVSTILFLCGLGVWLQPLPVLAFTVGNWTVPKQVKVAGPGPHFINWSATYTGGPRNSVDTRLYDSDPFDFDDLIDVQTNTSVTEATGTISGSFKFFNDKKNHVDGTPNGYDDTGETVAEGYVWIETGLFSSATSPIFKIIKDPRKPGAAVGAHIKDGGQAAFDAAKGELSFMNGLVNQFSFNGLVSADPIVGASITIPTMTLQGQLLPGEHVFTNESVDTSKFEIASPSGVFMRADLEALAYFVADKRFLWIFNNIKLSGVSPSSPFYDPSLPDLGSKYVSGLDALMNPSSAEFNDQALPYYMFSPSVNIFDSSNGFASDLAPFSYASDSGTYVPEPTTASLLALGLISLLRARSRRSGHPAT